MSILIIGIIIFLINIVALIFDFVYYKHNNKISNIEIKKITNKQIKLLNYIGAIKLPDGITNNIYEKEILHSHIKDFIDINKLDIQIVGDDILVNDPTTDEKMIIKLDDLLNYNYYNLFYLQCLYYHIAKKLPEEIEKPLWFIKLDNYIKTYNELNTLYNDTFKRIGDIHIEDNCNEIIDNYNITCMELIDKYNSLNSN